MTRFPHISLINLYSVSECHDVSAVDLTTIDTLWSPKYAPCGTVMENVQAYIFPDDVVEKEVCTEVDLAPVSVPGELFIAGPVLARGYLNNPEQTARRFVTKNLFGKKVRLYRTGDRARFLKNGHLELIGRCDFMVKIRGYSVVLGAVEAALIQHPQLSAAVVVAEGEEGSDKKLVAYLVPTAWEDEKLPTKTTMRTFLADHLPHYAIPHVFAIMQNLPISDASGKLDRKKLPSWEQAKTLREESIKHSKDIHTHVSHVCVTKTQITLSTIWKDLLQLENVDLDMNFFDVGGHSLLAARLSSAIRKTFDIPHLVVGDILRYPVLLEMATFLDVLLADPKGTVVHSTINLQAEVILDPMIFPAATRKNGYSRYRVEMASRPPLRIFITGTTGFLGAHLLSTLLAETEATLYCLIRATDEEHALRRLVSVTKQYALPLLDIDRIVPILGDLSEPLLGLTSATFQLLASEIQAIIHNGANVNLMSSYSNLKAANVLGTQEVLRLAVTNGIDKTRVKPVHYISTNGVFPMTNDGVCTEGIVHDPSTLEDGYAQSKWVAENLILEARKRGLPVSILRPGNMSPSSLTGQWNRSDFIRLLCLGCVAIRAVPHDVPLLFDLTPVDFAAKAIVVCTALHPNKSLGQILHIQNPSSALSSKVFFNSFLENIKNSKTANEKEKENTHDIMNSIDLIIDSLSLAEWKIRLMEAVSHETTEGGELHQLSAGLDRFIDYLKVDAPFDTTELQKALKESNIKYPTINATYLSKIWSTVKE